MFHRDTVLAAIFALFVIVSAVDLVADFVDGMTMAHLVHEALFIVLSVIGLVWLMRHLLAVRQRKEQLADKLRVAKRASQDASADLIDYRSRFNDVLAQQFSDWKLSKSEGEVGRLLLKGLSLREIAAVRHTQEKTVRAQASSIYRKASLDGRHAFSAWFLEDIT